MISELIILFLVTISIYFYRWATKNNHFYVQRNIAADKPAFLFGSGKDVFLRRISFVDFLFDSYNRHDGRYCGTFEFRDPILLIRDPQLIKQVLIKEFDHFVNRRRFIKLNDENLFTSSLLLMENDKWRDMRTTLTPAFTGRKMRQMLELTVPIIEEAISDLTAETNDMQELNVKEFTGRLTMDIIASTAFGLQINSRKDKNNEFYRKASNLMAGTVLQQIKMMFMVLMPRAANYLKMEFFDKDFCNYFMSLVLDTMKYRQENNIQRPDMINLLMEARGMLPSTNETTKTHFRVWSDLEMVAQCFIFFFAAFEPLSNAMCFASHELMENPDVQEKIYQEIKAINDRNESITYDTLKKMPYIEMVVSEVLRKWPVTLLIDRVCNKDFTYEWEDGEKLEIKKGDSIRINMCGLQRDSKHFENPEKLDPERFNEENKANIDSGTYMPFGLGPRNCIANRLALMLLKSYIFYLIRDFELLPSPKTPTPLEFKKTVGVVAPINGFWLTVKPRSSVKKSSQ